MHIILKEKNYEKLTGVISDHPEVKTKFDSVFEVYAPISHLMMAKRFLTDVEKSLLINSCKSLGVLFPKHFNQNITPKLQEVIFYVPAFVEKWGTVGILREEDTEEQHHLLNAILLSLVSVKSKPKRLSLALKRRQIFRSGEKAKPKSRQFRCKNCSSKNHPVILVNNNCPNCGYTRGRNNPTN